MFRERRVESRRVRGKDHEGLFPHEEQACRHGDDAEERARQTRLAVGGHGPEGGAHPGVPDDGHALGGVSEEEGGKTARAPKE